MSDLTGVKQKSELVVTKHPQESKSSPSEGSEIQFCSGEGREEVIAGLPEAPKLGKLLGDFSADQAQELKTQASSGAAFKKTLRRRFGS